MIAQNDLIAHGLPAVPGASSAPVVRGMHRETPRPRAPARAQRASERFFLRILRCKEEGGPTFKTESPYLQNRVQTFRCGKPSAAPEQCSEAAL